MKRLGGLKAGPDQKKNGRIMEPTIENETMMTAAIQTILNSFFLFFEPIIKTV